jgi:S-adenosylmethionine:tRNA ribosyltransferase-isomerase
MHLSEYDFELPQHLIAQNPLGDRSASRLLSLDRLSKRIGHRCFADLPELLRDGDLLVRNETRVIPARLLGKKESGGQVELLLVKQCDPVQNIWRCMTRSSKPVRVGARIDFSAGVYGEVVEAVEDGHRLVRFAPSENFFETLERVGHMPREDHEQDKDRYQTVFANKPGAIAAPTAGLHFTEETFTALAKRNIDICSITLHVGPGTFLPVRTEKLDDHRMHSEAYEVTEDAAQQINKARAEGRRIIALGTTVTRTLEHAVDDKGLLQAGQGETALFIRPGFQFRLIDALITNFHLPKSTLLVLVSAFAGKDFILKAYQEAVEQEYRFFSYGDCMLIE